MDPRRFFRPAVSMVVAGLVLFFPCPTSRAHTIDPLIWQEFALQADFIGVVECTVAGGVVARYEVVEVWKGENTVQGQTVDIEVALTALADSMDVVRALFHGFDYRAFASDALRLLLPAVNHILSIHRQAGRERYLDALARVKRAFSLCGTAEEAMALRTEIAFFEAVGALIVKHTIVGQKEGRRRRHAYPALR